MPITPKELKNRPTIFDRLKGKSLPQAIETVIEIAYKGLTGRDVTIFKWEGKGKPEDQVKPPTDKLQ